MHYKVAVIAFYPKAHSTVQRPVELEVNLDKDCTKLENGSAEAECHP